MNNETRLLNETKRMARGLALPTPAQTVDVNTYLWEKRSGYADGAIARVHKNAPTMGFVHAHNIPRNSPDGSVIGQAVFYTKPGWTLMIRSSYGISAGDNNFAMELTRNLIVEEQLHIEFGESNRTLVR